MNEPMISLDGQVRRFASVMRMPKAAGTPAPTQPASANAIPART